MKIIHLAIRTLLRFKLYTCVNIIGLALSLACVMVISRYVYREITVDHFNKNLDRIYLVTQHIKDEIKPRFSYNFNSETGIGTPVITNNPAVKKIAPFTSFTEDNITVENKKFNARIIATDTTFFQILNFPIIRGNKISPLSDPQNAVISSAYAKKIFGTEDPIGKTIQHSNGNNVTITAVTGEPKHKSSLQFDVLLSYKFQKRWGRIFEAFVLLAPDTDYKALNKGLLSDAAANHNDSPFQLLPLEASYFDKSVHRFEDTFLQGNYTNMLILSAVGFLVLLVGVFNFVNIYTVLMLKRAREFGMKKVFGANSKQVLLQLGGENMVMVGIALFMAWVCIEASKSLLENQLNIPQVNNLKFDISLTAGILFLLPVATSVYPFLKYNYSPPISSLRSVTTGGNSVVSRSLFLSIQYIITFCLIVLSIFFMKQLNYMLHADLGYNTKNIIKAQFIKYLPSVFSLPQEKQDAYFNDISKANDEIKQRMDASPLFTVWTYGNSPHESREFGIRIKTPDGEFKEVNSEYMNGKSIQMYNLQSKEGRTWNDSIDNFYSYNFIINESAQKLFGIKDIKNTVLQPESRLWITGRGEDMSQNPPYQIIGVIKDFKSVHLSKATMPLVISYSPGSTSSKLMAEVAPGKKQEAITFLKKLHNDTVGGEFEYSFVEDEVNALYNDDKKAAYIYSVFATIAILISSMGLFSLSLFDVQQRYREIALRKVNGAQVSDIIFLLLRKYFVLLGISFIIAAPVAYICITEYLKNFANKAPVSWWIFAVAVIITAVISLGTLIVQVRKAANSDPATILKSE